MTVEIIRTQAGDAAALSEVTALLDHVNLPGDGVAEHLSHFLLARDEAKLLGCVGLEIHGEHALLRSLAVVPERQHTGLGKLLTECALEFARGEGAREIVLLTTTASDFFQRLFGFAPVERSRYDEVFAASAEWHLPRCSSAACLGLKQERICE